MAEHSIYPSWETQKYVFGPSFNLETPGNHADWIKTSRGLHVVPRPEFYSPDLDYTIINNLGYGYHTITILES